MSFAQGFAAGSAAAQRGLDMAETMRKRDLEAKEQQRLEEYRKQIGLTSTAQVTPQMQLTDRQVADLQGVNQQMQAQGLGQAYNIGQGNTVQDMGGKTLGASTFLGQQVAPDISAETQDQMRRQGILGATMEYDPFKGMAYKSNIVKVMSQMQS